MSGLWAGRVVTETFRCTDDERCQWDRRTKISQQTHDVLQSDVWTVPSSLLGQLHSMPALQVTFNHASDYWTILDPIRPIAQYSVSLILCYAQIPLHTFPRNFPIDREVANLLATSRCNGIGKRHDTTDTKDFCLRQLVTGKSPTCYGLAVIYWLHQSSHGETGEMDFGLYLTVRYSPLVRYSDALLSVSAALLSLVYTINTLNHYCQWRTQEGRRGRSPSVTLLAISSITQKCLHFLKVFL